MKEHDTIESFRSFMNSIQEEQLLLRWPPEIVRCQAMEVGEKLRSNRPKPKLVGLLL